MNFFQCAETHRKCRLMKSSVNNIRLTSSEKSGASPLEYDTTNVQCSMWAENEVSQEHCIVDGCRQEGNAGVQIYDWAKVISEQYDIGRERHKKRIIALLNAENFGLNGTWKTLKDVPACFDL